MVGGLGLDVRDTSGLVGDLFLSYADETLGGVDEEESDEEEGDFEGVLDFGNLSTTEG